MRLLYSSNVERNKEMQSTLEAYTVFEALEFLHKAKVV